MMFALLAAVVMITADNYKVEVLDSRIPVVLDAYTDWCHYCKGVAPLFAELSEEQAGKIKFVKLNIERVQSIASELDIQALPTFLFFKNSKIVGRQAGALDKKGFQEKFSAYFK